jgi:hypothetical protein
MGYQFAGFFASPAVPQPEGLPAGAVWREITSPFVGVGIRLPALIGKTPTRAEVETLARQLGIHTADRWLYLTYSCWAGRIDFVYGLGFRSGEVFGPVEEDGRDKVKAAYTGLMAEFGISLEEALDFEPFHRGYWGEA